MRGRAKLESSAKEFMLRSIRPKYSYNFTWLGRPIIQYPQDIVAMQEIVWSVKPDLIIETGIAHGGSLVLSASMLTLLEVSGAIKKGRVIGVDVDIRRHNRQALRKHPMYPKLTMIEGSSTDPDVAARVRRLARGAKRTLVCLDSNHTHDHVLAELRAYAPLVSVGSYCVVFDTIIERLPGGMYPDRPWGKGDNPHTAVREFLKQDKRFKADREVERRLLITVAPGGYLKRVR